MSRLTARRARGGFTLIELMIALTVGGIAITAIYAITAASTRTFHQQEQLATAQSQVRVAMNQLKRDIARAGFLSTPGINLPGQACSPIGAPLHNPGGSGALAGLSFFGNDVATDAMSGRSAVDPTNANAANGFTVDDIVLMGNFETAAEYPGASVILNNPMQVSVSSNWHSFQRDFTNWYTEANPPVIEGAALTRVFAEGRMIRLRAPSGQLHFATISSVTPAAGSNNTQITFQPAIAGDCVRMADGWVAPVSTIRYHVRNVPDDDEYPAAIREVRGPMAQLIREEVQPADKRTPLFAVDARGRGVGTRAVVDYVVGFNLAFTSTALTPAGSADAYDPGVALPQAPDNDDATPPTAGQIALEVAAINANPERVRSAVIDLAVRTPEQDPTFPWVNCRRMRCFQVFPTTGAGAMVGAARVRRLRSEVFLPNIAGEGY